MNAYVNNEGVNIEKAVVYTAPYQKRTLSMFVALTHKKPYTLRLQFDCEIDNLIIRPLRYNIPFNIVDKNSVEIYVENDFNFSVEPNGDSSKACMVFAGSAECLSKESYENIIYFEKGTHFPDEIKINDDNTLVYIDKDAVVNGTIKANNCSNIGIDGYGTLTMENYSRETKRNTSILIKNCRNVNIQNIIVRDSCNWHVNIWGCDNVVIKNVKAISHRQNTDGFDICGSRNVSVSNCFARVWDDGLVVKGVDTGDVENIQFSDCVLWNDFARPIELGVSIRADKMHNVLFKNIDIIHSGTGYTLMGIHHGDRAEVYDVRFENINVEDTPGAQLFDMRITDSVWNHDKKKGKIHNFIFKNINLIGKPGIDRLMYHSRIQGYSKEHNISDVTFENIRLLGKCARSADDLGLDIFSYADNIRVIGTEGPFMERILSNIVVNDFKLKPDGFYYGTVTVKLKNTSDKKKTGTFGLAVNPLWFNSENERIAYEINPYSEYTHTCAVKLPAGKYAFTLKSTDIDLLGSVGYVSLDLVLDETFEKCASYSFNDSFGHLQSGVKFALKKDLLLIKTDLLKKFDFTVYAAKPVAVNDGEMLFSVEDSNTNDSPAIIRHRDSIVEAPQIGCPEEIFYVFNNQPKVERINSFEIKRNITGETYVDFSLLGLEKNCNNFWLEMQIHDGSDKRYPFTLFASPTPEKSAHMFVNVIRKGDDIE